MSQIERGGQNIQRWPAEVPETGTPEGKVGEEWADEEQTADAERLAALPEHERDPDDDFGGGLMSSGATVTDYGHSEAQPVPAEEAADKDRDTDTSGLPPSGTGE